MSQLVDVTLPAAAQEGTESQVGSWYKAPGQAVKQHEPLLEIVTDKVTVEISAPADGVLQEVLKQTGEKVAPDDVLGRIAVGATAGAAAPAPVAATAPVAAATAAPSRGQTAMINALSPSVRRLVKEHNIDVAQIAGSGRGGRVTLADIEAHIAANNRGTAKPAAVARPAPVIMPPTQAGTSKRIPHSPMRKGIADHMVKSALQIAPHVTAIFDADLTAVMKHRNMVKKQFENQGVKLTLTAYFVSATVRALQAVPEVNARFHEDAIELFADCNIGVAAAIPDGLVVPVIHGAQSLNLLGTARKLQDITDRARTNKLTPGDVQNGTFTITNHGGSGSLIATPIINQPQSAILGIGKVEKRLVVIEVAGQDTIQIRPKVFVTLTIDHRGLDGFTANRFLSTWVEAIESWPTHE